MLYERFAGIAAAGWFLTKFSSGLAAFMWFCFSLIIFAEWMVPRSDRDLDQLNMYVIWGGRATFLVFLAWLVLLMLKALFCENKKLYHSGGRPDGFCDEFDELDGEDD